MAIYRSNLIAPNLRPYFKLADPPLQNCGHDVPSDPDFDPNCGYWTDDEAAILYQVARQVGGQWADLGGRLGWTTAHIAAAGGSVDLIEPEAARGSAFTARLEGNLNNFMVHYRESSLIVVQKRAQGYLQEESMLIEGFVIDADHDAPQPTLDALGCERIAKPDAVILMHDFWGRPIQDAVETLMRSGWRCRIYDTPNGVALLWRGYRCDGGGPCLHPPNHVPDPAIDWLQVRRGRAKGFSFERTE